MKKGILFALTTVALMGGEIKVGILQPLTGPISSFGQKTLDGIKLIHKKFNKLPNGDTIKLIIVDGQFDKVQSVNGYKRLVDKEKVVAIEGPLASSISLAIKRFAGASKTPTVTQIATNPRVTQRSKYITRACFTDNFQGEVAAKYALKHNLKKAVVVFDMKQDYSVGLAKAFKTAYQKGGGKILKMVYINSGDRDFNAQVAQIKRLKPDFIYTPIYAPEEGMFLRQLRMQQITTPVMGGDGIADPDILQKLAKEYADGVMFTDHFDPAKPPTKVSKEFVEEFKKVYHRLPSAFAATGADGYLLIYNGIKKCVQKGLKPSGLKFKQCVNSQIRNTTKLEGVTGVLTIDPKNGNPLKKPAVIEKFVKGKAQFVELIQP